MTFNGLSDRLARLEQRRNPPPDPRVADEARERVVSAVLGLAATIEPAEPGEPDFDLAEAVTAIIEARRRGEE